MDALFTSLKGIATSKGTTSRRGGYLSFLKQHRAAVVVKDNATVHNKAFAENGVRMLNCPAKSPSMTPIESLWSMMDTHKSGINLLNREALHDTIQASYSFLIDDVNYAESTIRSVPNRMRMVIERDGGHCWY